jgi:glyoxylase-like metal-dependent hydrolase (beta-lactamase superfamily II)
VLGGAHTADERLSFILLSFLVEGPAGEKALIDLGPMTLEYTSDMFRRYKFFRDLGPEAPPEKRYPDDIVQPRGNVFRQLEKLGVAPREVDHIVFTHLHADHHGMDDAKDGGAAERFTEAAIHASRIGWEQNLEKRKDGRWGSYVDYAFSDFLLEREAAGKARFADDEEIFPGLRTLYLGGHSICSQAVIVETAEGPVIITSDDIYHYSLLEKNVLPRIHTSPPKYEAAVERLVKLAKERGGILLPVHDPEIWKAYEEHGDGWLGALRVLSDAAIRGYESSRSGAARTPRPEPAPGP